MTSQKPSKKIASSKPKPSTGGATVQIESKVDQRPRWSLLEKMAAVASGLIPFAVYIYFLCPTIAAGDSAELVTSAEILGISHPPGYPLFTVIGHVFSMLPINSVAWRVNLASAVFSSLTCLFVYLSLLRLTRRALVAFTGALALAFSRYFWHYAEVAEVFPLNDFFAAILTFILILIYQRAENHRDPIDAGTIRLLWLLSFVYGLAFTNHHTIVLLGPAVFVFLWITARGIFRYGKVLGIASIFFIAGFSFYFYCPLAALSKPLINWDNPVTLNNFLRLLTRADYGTFSLMASEVTHNVSTTRFDQLLIFLTDLNHQFTALGVGLALLGILNFKRRKIFQTYLALAFFFSGIFFVLFAKVPAENALLLGVFHRFFILPALFFALWIGLGMDAIWAWIEKRNLRRFVGFSPIPLALGLIAWQFTSNVDEADYRENYIAEDFAHNILSSLPGYSLFFVRGDVASMGVDYLQMVLRKRPDVICLDQAKLTYDWYYRQVKERFPNLNLPGERYEGGQIKNKDLIAANIGRRPVSFMSFKEESYQQEFRAAPVGLVYRMLPKSQSFSLEELEKHNERLYASFAKRGWEKKYPATSFENEIVQIYAEPFFRLAFEFEQAGQFAKADLYYNKALAMNALNHKVIKNLAVLYFYKMNRQVDGAKLFARYLELNPNDVEAGKIRQLIDAAPSP
jgi:tetratricopeptide (TPR) repeat protein